MHSRLGSFIILAAITGALIAPAAASAQGPDLNVSDSSVVEGTGAEIWFDVSRGEPTTTDTYVHFEVSPGTALFPDDYGQFFDSDGVNDSNLNFDTGVTTLRITVPIVNDSLFEADEDLFVDLGTAINGTVVDGEGRGTILNDDGAAPPPGPPSSTTPAPAPKPKKKKKCKKKGKKASAAKKCKK